MTQLLPALAETGQHILLAVPDPSVGGNPPGYEKLLTVLHWVFLAVTVACVSRRTHRRWSHGDLSPQR